MAGKTAYAPYPAVKSNAATAFWFRPGNVRGRRIATRTPSSTAASSTPTPFARLGISPNVPLRTRYPQVTAWGRHHGPPVGQYGRVTRRAWSAGAAGAVVALAVLLGAPAALAAPIPPGSSALALNPKH